MDIFSVALVAIVGLLFMIYLSTRSIVEVLNHWGLANDKHQEKILEELERLK
jgi:hypothetical protein